MLAGCHHRLLRRLASVTGAHIGDRQRVRALLLADLMQQPVRLGIAGRALIEDVDLVVLGSLARGEQPVDRCDPRLQARPQGEPDAVRRRHLDADLAHAGFETLAVTRLRVGHPPHDLGLAIWQPVGDQLIGGARFDLATPCCEQSVADLWRRLRHRPAD